MHFKGDRVAGYARYSSDRQSESSVEDQLRRIRGFASKSGKRLDESLTFTDHAISGASTARPGFEALMERIKRREIDVLLVEDTSRLSRDNADALNLYKNLAFYGVQLVAISDGIDSSTKGAKLAYSVKALMSDLYLEDLRDKTLRGMEGRALQGKATGGRLFGYRTVPVLGPDGRTPTHFNIEIDPEQAKVIRRIFADYLAGRSLSGIATTLNREGLPAPRDKTQHGVKTGWGGMTIRAMLRNERYTGVQTFNQRRWVKIPGTNKRRAEMKDPSEVIRTTCEELRIIDADTWERTQERVADVCSRYTKTPEGNRKGRALGWISNYPFSGLLTCGACKSVMVVRGGGADRRYYFCSASARGRCENKKGVLTRVVEEKFFEMIRERVSSPAGIARARKRIAEKLGELARSQAETLKEKRSTLSRIEARIANLVSVLASGENSQAIRDALRDMESHAKTEKRAIEAVEQLATSPVRLPAPDEILSWVVDLEMATKQDPIAARERLRLYLKGPIQLDWRGQHYEATAPLGSILTLKNLNPPPPEGEAGLNVLSSGGRI